MDIYLSQGYTEREAAQSILAHNLYGLDIDDRAYQLTYFSLMMKARQYDRRLFSRELRPQVCAIEESNGLTKWSDMRGQVEAEQMSLEDQFVNLADELIDTFRDAKNYGSLLQVEPGNYDGLLDYMQQLLDEGCNNLFLSGWLQEVAERIPKLVRQAKLLRQKYWVCITNPPYMGAGNMNPILGSFMKKCYPNSKSDLSTAFMERCLDFLAPTGFMAMINIPVWMFLSSYEKLRHIIATQDTYISMAHLGRGVFGSDFGTTAFVIGKKRILGYQGTYFRLFEKQGAVDSIEQKRKWFLEKKGFHIAKQENFAKIPGEPVAYWASKPVIEDFVKGQSFNKFAAPKQGSTIGDNDKFLRLWYEISDVTIKTKWYRCLKGGPYRKWYGNHLYLINWENNGQEIKKLGKCTIRNANKLFKEGISWSRITRNPSFRLMLPDYFFESASGVCFPTGDKLLFTLGFLNTKVVFVFSELLNPTLTLQSGDLANIPLLEKNIPKVDSVVKENISLSKSDWDSFETSWDFQGHPLVQKGVSDLMSVMLGESTGGTLEDRYLDFKAACEDRFLVLQKNEEELNRIFIDLYGLQDELTPEVADKDITVHKVFDRKEDVPASMVGSSYVLTKEDVMKSLLSYAVGCLFGRYSLDTPGLAYAGGEWDAGKYQTFIPDDDNVVPITDEEYFDDDLPSFICAWLKKAFGRENFEANLEFLTDALGTRGATPKEKLRNYFLKNFYKDHCKTYQKRPIYWLFDSGKENGFKAFVYIHRWTKDTEGRVLLYLHKVQSKYETELRAIDMNLENLSDKRRAARLEKRKDHLQKQLAEIKDYDEILDHMANEQLTMDLDDGVKVNYEKMQTDREGVTYPILAKIK